MDISQQNQQPTRSLLSRLPRWVWPVLVALILLIVIAGLWLVQMNKSKIVGCYDETLNSARKLGYQLAENGKCPQGFFANQALCADSAVWCQPIDNPESGPCAAVITPARNPATGEVVEFPTPCDVPEGWERVKGTDVAAWENYRSERFGLTFRFPSAFLVFEEGESLVVAHEVPFENNGACDMMGDEQVYPMRTDFRVRIRVMPYSIADAVRELSPYMPEENFAGSSLKPNPGFIDPATLSGWSGYKIFEGAEGCGHEIYYLTLSEDRTLVVSKDLVQEFSGAVSEERRQALLSVPGVITPKESNEIFEQIVASIRID